jgi:Flp pilus assembly protein TadD
LPKPVCLEYFVTVKRLAVFVFWVLTLSVSPLARAQSNPDDQYLIIYALIQQGDAFDHSGEPRRALDDYTEAQTDLQKFQRVFPDWNPKIVNFRLSYLAERIAEVTARLPSTKPPPAVAGMKPATANAPGAPAAPPNPELQTQLNALHDQVKQLQTENQTLQSKLKEALAVQPATVSPDQYAQLQQQLRLLMKENDLLKVGLSRGNGMGMAGVDALTVESLKQALADQTIRADTLTLENQALQTRMRSLMTNADAMEALRQENELLKKQLTGYKSAPVATVAAAGAAAELVSARAEIASLQSAAEVNSLEKIALEDHVKKLEGVAAKPSSASGPSAAEYESHIRELELERDALLARLGEANRKLYGRKGQDAAAQIDALAQQVDTLRARVAVDEAQPIPYTAEELALFKQPAPQLSANPNAEKKSVHELPVGTATLVAEAQTHFAARDYAKAEANYQEILRKDQNNGLALANLATIELEENKLDDAEKHIQAALAQSPNDPYNLTVLGRIQFAEAKYDDALDTLSRAAKIDPRNPDIENYLGVTLAQKGLRTQAETALRRAVQLDPNYGAAHNNLAVIYLTQEPPLVELARWHYQKALAAGQPHNPALEKMLADKGAPASQ